MVLNMTYFEGTVGTAGTTGATGAEEVAGALDAGIFVCKASTTDLFLWELYVYVKNIVFAINKTPRTKVTFVKKPAGPFAPKSDSLLPL